MTLGIREFTYLVIIQTLLLTICGKVGKTSSFWDIKLLIYIVRKLIYISEVPSSSRIPSGIQTQIWFPLPFTWNLLRILFCWLFLQNISLGHPSFSLPLTSPWCRNHILWLWLQPIYSDALFIRIHMNNAMVAKYLKLLKPAIHSHMCVALLVLFLRRMLMLPVSFYAQGSPYPLS